MAAVQEAPPAIEQTSPRSRVAVQILEGAACRISTQVCLEGIPILETIKGETDACLPARPAMLESKAGLGVLFE